MTIDRVSNDMKSDHLQQENSAPLSVESLIIAPEQSKQITTMHSRLEKECHIDSLPSFEVFDSRTKNTADINGSQLTEQMYKNLFDGGFTNPHFYVSTENKRDIASCWDMGQVMESLTSSAQVFGDALDSGKLRQALNAMNKYFDKNSRPPGYDSGFGPQGDKYYDDNAWVGIACMDAYKYKKDPYWLDKAKRIFEFDEFGARGTDKLAKPGGVFWTQQPDNLYRATVSTAGSAQLALQLYEVTQNKRHLEFARQQFDWVNQYLRTPAGLYKDGMDKDGKLHPEAYTYNQGLMLGDAAMLYKATKDPLYLKMAQDIAKTSLAAFDDNGSKIPGENPNPFSKQPLFFNAVFFKNLMLLDSISPDASYRKALDDYANKVKSTVNADGLVTVEGRHTLLDQSSAIQVLELARTHPV